MITAEWLIKITLKTQSNIGAFVIIHSFNRKGIVNLRRTKSMYNKIGKIDFENLHTTNCKW